MISHGCPMWPMLANELWAAIPQRCRGFRPKIAVASVFGKIYIHFFIYPFIYTYISRNNIIKK